MIVGTEFKRTYLFHIFQNIFVIFLSVLTTMVEKDKCFRNVKTLNVLFFATMFWYQL